MKPLIKSGVMSGSKMMFFFTLVSLFWALIIKLSENLSISPGWSMLAIFIIAIFSMSIATEKTKYDLEKSMQKAKVKREDT